MYFLGLGLLLVVLKLLEFGAVAEWSWWIVLTPFALAAAWWQWADWSGYTKRKEMEKMDDIKRKRLLAQRDALKRQPGNERRR
ncbi:MAG: TIGR04438 family Trp-rich protein [Brachymonas sp.]|jgi:small Trp-rich protein|uniref:TIGR04438 family Trp-rich protein n=1 Tax=unclassified Brachymonas TaxID=2621329 RepID=UPI0035AF6B61